MKKLAVIGYPVGHSFSPIMHNFISKKLNLPYEYEAVEVLPGKVAETAKKFLEEGYAGFNVTAPHKLEVMESLSEISEDAKRIGAVNTVAIRDGKLYGYNTDGDGFLMSLKYAGIEVENAHILVLGAGGAAKPVVLKLSEKNIASITLINRTKEKAEALAEYVKTCTEREVATEIKREKYDIIINCTSLGMGKNVGINPLSDMSLIGENTWAIDLIYNPYRTQFLLECEKCGAKVLNGLGMLIFQGILAYQLFTDIAVPMDMAAEIEAEILKKIEENKPENIVLTGYMGSGKTCVGNIIAKKTGLEFCDTDAIIEKESGMEISEIFAKFGEEHFRNLETKTIEKLSKKRGLLISTGGGAVLRRENIDLLRKNGRVVNLEPTEAVIKQRLSGEDKKRPLISGNSFAEILERFESRRPFYDNCDIKVIIDETTSAECVADEVIKALEEKNEG